VARDVVPLGYHCVLFDGELNDIQGGNPHLTQGASP